mmetsp:Transcript_12428/g.52286  ORF Transcript_12428/g.52286 Transcript_12428/m.52286 type:complete len:203 (+) Transcript_12428:2323-2931(+)
MHAAPFAQSGRVRCATDHSKHGLARCGAVSAVAVCHGTIVQRCQRVARFHAEMPRADIERQLTHPPPLNPAICAARVTGRPWLRPNRFEEQHALVLALLCEGELVWRADVLNAGVRAARVGIDGLWLVIVAGVHAAHVTSCRTESRRREAQRALMRLVHRGADHVGVAEDRGRTSLAEGLRPGRSLQGGDDVRVTPAVWEKD